MTSHFLSLAKFPLSRHDGVMQYYGWTKGVFFRRITRNMAIGASIIFFSLLGGMFGYRYFEEMSWVDAYLNAAMILSGMGPVQTLQTEAGKIFAGSYALFSGILFLVTIAIVFAPVVHRFFHGFHLEEK